LAYLSAVSGNLLSCLPLELKLRGKSTAQSFGKPIFYVDLVIRSGLTLEAAIQQARELDAARRAGGFDQAALEQAAKLGFEQGVFEDDAEDVAAVVEEFFPTLGEPGASAVSGISSPMLGHQLLSEKQAWSKALRKGVKDKVDSARNL
jgi:hypothetical protein